MAEARLSLEPGKEGTAGQRRPSRARLLAVPRRLALWLSFTAVILVASFFRFYRLADHPLGLFFDPAINGLDVIRLIERGGLVIFFPTNGGREALFMYMLVPLVRLFGTIPFSPRFLTAIISLLTVALLFACLVDLRAAVQPPKLNANAAAGPSPLWPALVAGMALAGSYWHIAVSRLAQRPILVPMLAVPIFWLFLKGWTSGKRRSFVLAGLLLGLAGYTYSAARLLPLIMLLALAPELGPLLAGRAPFSAYKSRLINLALLAGVALVVYSPMAWYLLTHPAQFVARAGSVMVWHFLDTPAAVAAEIGRNALRVLGFFCCTGQDNPIFGLPGRPGLSPLLAPLLLVGLAGALRDWRSLFHRLVAGWWFVGLLPSVVAIEAPHPWRMIVALVPTAILIALAPLYVIQSRWGQRLGQLWYTYAFVLILILATLPGTFRAYFIDWTDLKVTRSIYDYNAIALRDRVLEQTAGDPPIYLPLSRFNDSTLLFYLSGRYHRQAALAVPSDPRGALVIAPERNRSDTTWVRLQGQTATVLPPLTDAGQQLIQAALSASPLPPLRSLDGEIAGQQARLATDPARFVESLTRPVTATLGPARLVGANYAPVIDPAAGQMPVTLFWQAAAPMADEYEVLLHLVDDRRRAWGNGDGRPTDWIYPTTFWRPGQDWIAGQQVVRLEAVPPPGRYWLAVALFNPATGERLPLQEGNGDSPDTFFLGPLKVPLTISSPPPGDWQAVGITFGDTARLAGFIPEQLTVAAGEPVRFSLVWEALATPAVDYTVFVHLLDAAGHLVAGSDSQPVGGSYPTTIWTPGEQIRDAHSLPTTGAGGRPLPPGRYRLAVGLYHQPTGARLPLHPAAKGEEAGGEFILAQPVTITGE